MFACSFLCTISIYFNGATIHAAFLFIVMCRLPITLASLFFSFFFATHPLSGLERERKEVIVFPART